MKKTRGTLRASNMLVDEMFQNIEYRYEHRNDKPELSWGFEDLDALTNGIQRATLTIIGGRPSMGKTTFMLNVAIDLAVVQQKSILIFNAETSSNYCLDRMLNINAQTNIHKWRTGHVTSQDWTNLTLAMARLKEAPMYFIEDCRSIAALAKKCRKLKRKTNSLDLIFIDDLQTLLMREFPNIRPEGHTQITWQLKQLARELEVAIIATSNLSRAPEYRSNKRPLITDIKDGAKLGDAADTIIMLYRDEYYNPESEQRGEAELIICRQKAGPTGTAEALYQGSTGNFFNRLGNI